MFSLHKARARMLSDAVPEWLGATSHLALNTRLYYKRNILEFLEAIGDKPISKILSSEIKNYLQKKLWNLKKSSTNNAVVVLRCFFKFAAEKYNIPNPAENIKKYKPDPYYQPFITKGKYEKVLVSATQQQKDVVQFLAMTGLRVSELANLEYENITENFSAIRFYGKCNKRRAVALNQTAREILSRHCKGETIINFPKSKKNIYTLCQRAGLRTGVKLTPHMLRRLFASELIKYKSLLEVSFLMGHSSIRTTEIYLHIDSSFLAGSTDCLDG